MVTVGEKHPSITKLSVTHFSKPAPYSLLLSNTKITSLPFYTFLEMICIIVVTIVMIMEGLQHIPEREAACLFSPVLIDFD